MEEVKDEDNVLDTEDIVKNIAERAGFTLGDTRIFLRAMQEVFEDCIEQNYVVKIRGFISMRTQILKPFRGVNAHASRLAGETVFEEFGESKRVIIKLATNMTDILRPEGKKKIKKTEKIMS